jgi:hypothetical protein
MIASPNTPADVSRFILNCLPSPKPERNWTIETATDAGIFAPKASVPPAVDLRADWWPVGNQGGTGSCVGWGSGDGILRWHFTKAGRLGQHESLSVRYLWMAAKETDVYATRPTTFIERDGTWLTAALDIARKFGVVTESVLRFENPASTPELYTQGTEETFYALAAQRRIACYFNLGRSQATWRSWIANHGPILTRLDVDSSWDNATAMHGHLGAYDAANTRGGHCVVLVGYTPDHFIVRNSWGKGWGDHGFAYASEKYARPAFTEAYGITL